MTTTDTLTRFTHILAPVDFSEPCLRGLATAASLAKRTGAKLTAVHIVQHLHQGSLLSHGVADVQSSWKQVAREKLDEFLLSHLPADLPVERVVREGHPFDEIAKVATEQGCDLIVTATHGHTGFAHVLLGSTAERVLQHASCSVLVVRGLAESAAQELAPAWILVPTDFSENSSKAFPVACSLAKDYGARVILAHVTAGLDITQDMALPLSRGILKDLLAEVEAKLKQWRVERLDPALEITTQVLHGEAYRCLTHDLPVDGPGLIVMSTHGYTGWRHALLGSTAERVARHATCPVLVVR